MTVRTPAYYGGEPIREDVLGYGSQSISETEKAAVVKALDGDYSLVDPRSNDSRSVLRTSSASITRLRPHRGPPHCT